MTTKRINCPICNSSKDNPKDKYCKDHTKAKTNLKQGYESWLNAYGVLSWNNYLQKLLEKDIAIGKLVKDIIEYELYFD